MGFNPSSSTWYYLISRKFPNRCLDVKGVSPERGAPIHVWEPIKDAGNQHFAFEDAGMHQFFIRARHSGHYLDIYREDTGNGTHLHQFSHRGSDNQKFQFISAGKGYYFIRCFHSGKFLQLRSGDFGGAVEQWDQDRGEQAQQFMPVPVEGVSRVGTQLGDIADISDRLRTLVMGIMSTTPTVGGALSGMVGFFWPASGPSAILSAVKEFVEKLVRELISQERIRDLENRLKGLQNVVQNYAKTSFSSPQKGSLFTSLLTELTLAEPYFFDSRDPVKTLSYFVTLGTIHLTILREQVDSYNAIYKADDPDREVHRQQLKDKVQEYFAAATKSRDNILAWRKGKVTIRSGRSSGLLREYSYTVEDAYTGWSHEWNLGNDSIGTVAQNAYSARQSIAEAQMTADLDAIFAPAYLWPYLDPDKAERPAEKAVIVKTGPFGGKRYSSFQDPQDRRIAKVVVYAGSRVDGVELFYGTLAADGSLVDIRSGGVHGKVGGNTHALSLEPGESIVGAWGRYGDAMDQLWFETDKGRTVGGGGGGGSDWRADPPEGLRAYLFSISGYQGTGHLEGIVLHWRYTVQA